MNGTNEEERLIDYFSTHWIKYAGPTFVYGHLMALAVLIFSLSLPAQQISQ